MQKASTKLPPLDLLPAFEAAARHLSFTKAGAERFLTQSAVSRQIKALEEDLGVLLFRRHRKTLALTEDGRRLYEASIEVLTRLRQVVGHIRATPERQVLALTTTPGLASLWLIPRLFEFTQGHPGIDVRMDATFSQRDLAAEGFDLAIRYGRVASPLGIPLFREAMLPVCSPKLMQDKRRPLGTPSDLRHHTLLQVAIPAGSSMPLEWDPWLQAIGISDIRFAATLTFTNYDDAIAAALSGQGIALGRRPIVNSLLKSKRLVAPFKGSVASPRGYFLIVLPESSEKPAVKALVTWLLQQGRQRD